MDVDPVNDRASWSTACLQQAAHLPTIREVAPFTGALSKDLSRPGVFLTARRNKLADSRRNTLPCRTVGAGLGHPSLLHRDVLRFCNFPSR